MIVAFVLLALLIFGIVWLLMSRFRRKASRGTRRPLAPDDNPEFLRSIQIPRPPSAENSKVEPDPGPEPEPESGDSLDRDDKDDSRD